MTEGTEEAARESPDEVVYRPRTIDAAPVARPPLPAVRRTLTIDPAALSVTTADGGLADHLAADDPYDDVFQPVTTETTTDAEAGEGRRMARANIAVATGTLLSRITGLARTGLMFLALAPTLRDAYILANNTPNIIYELILGGVLTATLVPLFTEFVTTRDDDATAAVVSASILGLVILTVLALVLSPALMLLYATNTPRGVSHGEFVSIGIRMAILFAPQIFFYGLMAVASALLNARRRFFAAAWTPVLNNVIVIGVLLAVWRLGSKPGLETMSRRPGLLLLLGLGTTAGIVAMAVALFPALRRAGIPMRFTRHLRHPAVKRAMVLSGWTVGYVIANQVAGQVINVLTEPGSGGTSNYQLASQFFQLPHSLLAVSLMTTFQPELARAYALKDEPAFVERLLRALRLLTGVILPAAVLLVAVPIATLVPAARISPNPDLFVLGSHSLRLGDSTEIARIVAAFCTGLLGFSLYLFILRVFYARGDTRMPFYVNCVENAINIVVALLLVSRYGVVGLALSYGVAYTVAAVLAGVVLVRRLDGFDLRGLLTSYARLAAAAVVMTVVILAVGLGLHAHHGSALLVSIALSALLGTIAYVVAVVVFRVPGMDQLARRLPGRGRRGAPDPA